MREPEACSTWSGWVEVLKSRLEFDHCWGLFVLLHMGLTPRVMAVLRRLLQGRCNTRRLRLIDPTGLLRGTAQPVDCVRGMSMDWGAE